jgi:hypothetical protein
MKNHVNESIKMNYIGGCEVYKIHLIVFNGKNEYAHKATL